MASIWRSPPESEPADCDILWPKIGKSSITSFVAAVTAFLSFCQSPVKAKLSFTLNSAITDLPSETCIIPERAKSSARLPNIETPFQLALPEEASFKPDKVLSNVVLPAPFAPMIAASWPCGTLNETLFIALIAP